MIVGHLEITWPRFLLNAYEERHNTGYRGSAYVTQGLEMWTMFLTGFLAMFVITQMHGLRLSFAAKLVLAVSIVIPCVVIYCNKELYRLNEPIRIPFINYLGVFVLAGILYVVRIVKMAF